MPSKLGWTGLIFGSGVVSFLIHSAYPKIAQAFTPESQPVCNFSLINREKTATCSVPLDRKLIERGNQNAQLGRCQSVAAGIIADRKLRIVDPINTDLNPVETEDIFANCQFIVAPKIKRRGLTHR